VSAYPLVLEGDGLDTLVVGGGAVAERKVRALLAAGARVRVVAPTPSNGLRSLASATLLLSLVEREYEPGDVDGATLVIAATNSRETNAAVAAEARAERRVINVADAPREGNAMTVATHRAGELVIAVFAGGVPAVAARVRDALAERFDGRYADAISALATLRRRLLASGGREAWRRAVDTMVAEDFCDRVERGIITAEAAAWR
jgi:siroheme synthase-like protein